MRQIPSIPAPYFRSLPNSLVRPSASKPASQRDACAPRMLTRTWILTLAIGATLLPAVTTSCGARETNMSTNTGNPPVVDRTLVRISAADDEVIVTGEPGAVETSGSEQVVAKVTNLSNDATGSATVGSDGSFEVRVSGTVDDDYELTVTTRGAAPTTVTVPQTEAQTDSGPMTCLERTGGTPNEGGTRGPQPICGTLNAEASCLTGELATTVSLDCESNDDCVIAPNRSDCTDSCNSGMAVSLQGASELAAGLVSINETTCQDFDDEGCAYHISGCTPIPQLAARCEDGQCVGKSVQRGFECSEAVFYPDAASCVDYATEALCQRDRLLAGLENTCEQDDDCEVLYTSLSCAPDDCTGQHAVPKSVTTAIEDGMTTIEQGICAQAGQDCDDQSIACEDVDYVASCIAGACTLEFQVRVESQ